MKFKRGDKVTVSIVGDLDKVRDIWFGAEYMGEPPEADELFWYEIGPKLKGIPGKVMEPPAISEPEAPPVED